MTWVLATVPQGTEFVVRDGAGFSVYVPALRKLVRVRGKRSFVEIAKPAFPGYVFAELAALHDGAFKQRFKAAFVRSGTNVVQIPDSSILAIQRFEAANFTQSYYDALPAVVKGKSIKLVANSVTVIIPLD